MDTKTKTTKQASALDPDRALLQAEGAVQWLPDGAVAAVILLRDWWQQLQDDDGGVTPPDWPEFTQSLDVLAGIAAQSEAYGAALHAGRKELKDAEEGWVRGGPLDTLLHARTRLDALETVQLKDLWAVSPEPVLAPLRQVGDRIVTEWMRPQIEYYAGLIRAAYPPALAAQLRFGVLTSEQMSVNNAAVQAVPEVSFWWSQLRDLQHAATGLRKAGILTVADAPDGLDRKQAQSPVRYNWAEPLHNMIQLDNYLTREDDLATFLYATIVSGRTPTLLTGPEVDERADGTVPVPETNRFMPGLVREGSVAIQHGGGSLYGEEPAGN